MRWSDVSFLKHRMRSVQEMFHFVLKGFLDSV